MNKKQKKYKQVLENLDRIVAGEKLNSESGLDDDTKAALELSREMTSWSKSPSKEFNAQLKAKIIHQLAEQNKQEGLKNGDSEFRDLLHRPAWQFTIAAVIVAIIAVIIALIVLWINKAP
jgi:hypothetical protein